MTIFQSRVMIGLFDLRQILPGDLGDNPHLLAGRILI
jgi:hypothetical protein